MFIAALDGPRTSRFRALSASVFRLDAVGAIRQALHAHKCTDLVIIGPVKRPSIFSLRPDAEGVKLLAKIGRAAFAGDDGLLAAVLRVLGEEGFNLLGAHDILGDALAPPGLLTTRAPDTAAMADIERGIAVLKIIGAADIGQACVVQQGIVLAVEAVEGTDAMLARIPRLRAPVRWGFGKACQTRAGAPGRYADNRFGNYPSCAGSRAAGVAFEAGGTILADRKSMIEAADAAGMFLLGVSPRVFSIVREIL